MAAGSHVCSTVFACSRVHMVDTSSTSGCNGSANSTFRTLFRDSSKPLTIDAKLKLSSEEIAYLHANAETVSEPLAWAEVTNQPPDNFGFSSLGFAAQFPHLTGQVAGVTTQRAAELQTELTRPTHVLSLTIPSGAGIAIVASAVAHVVFQTFMPR